MKKERTLIAIKPDGVQRQLVGEVISRFEKASMKLAAAKFIAPSRAQVKKHYYSEEWLLSTGENTLKSYKEKGLKINLTAREIGLKTLNRLIDYWTDRPTMLMIWQGPNVVQIARKILGSTSPQDADVGSIRGDYSLESYAMADNLDRSIYNLVHASGSPAEAEKEIKIWFKKSEILDYDLFLEQLLHNRNWGRVKKNLG
jgi:nucleoside-diphosphate kinase